MRMVLMVAGDPFQVTPEVGSQVKVIVKPNGTTKLPPNCDAVFVIPKFTSKKHCEVAKALAKQAGIRYITVTSASRFKSMLIDLKWMKHVDRAKNPHGTKRQAKKEVVKTTLWDTYGTDVAEWTQEMLRIPQPLKDVVKMLKSALTPTPNRKDAEKLVTTALEKDVLLEVMVNGLPRYKSAHSAPLEAHNPSDEAALAMRGLESEGPYETKRELMNELGSYEEFFNQNLGKMRTDPWFDKVFEAAVEFGILKRDDDGWFVNVDPDIKITKRQRAKADAKTNGKAPSNGAAPSNGKVNPMAALLRRATTGGGAVPTERIPDVKSVPKVEPAPPDPVPPLEPQSQREVTLAVNSTVWDRMAAVEIGRQFDIDPDKAIKLKGTIVQEKWDAAAQAMVQSVWEGVQSTWGNEDRVISLAAGSAPGAEKAESREDISKLCRYCSAPFTWTAGEQKFYKEMRFEDPVRCHECRQKKGSMQLAEHRAD